MGLINTSPASEWKNFEFQPYVSLLWVCGYCLWDLVTFPSMSAAFSVNSLSSQQVAIVRSRVLNTHIEKDEASWSEVHVRNQKVFWLQVRVIFDCQEVSHGNFKQTAIIHQQNSSEEIFLELGGIWPEMWKLNKLSSSLLYATIK